LQANEELGGCRTGVRGSRTTRQCAPLFVSPPLRLWRSLPSRTGRSELLPDPPELRLTRAKWYWSAPTPQLRFAAGARSSFWARPVNPTRGSMRAPRRCIWRRPPTSSPSGRLAAAPGCDRAGVVVFCSARSCWSFFFFFFFRRRSTVRMGLQDRAGAALG